MSKSLNHPTREVSLHLQSFAKTKNFSDYMAALEIALVKKLMVPELKKVWAANKDDISHEPALDQFMELVPRLEVRYTHLQEMESVIQTSNSALDKAKTFEFINLLAHEEGAWYDEKETSYGPRYSWFWPAYEIADLIWEEIPQENDPGAVIANYLRAIFPETHPSLPWSRDIEITHGSQLHSLLTEIGHWLIDRCDSIGRFSVQTKVALDCLLSPEDQFDRNSLRLIFHTAIFLPRPLFQAWLCNWWLEYPEGLRQPKLDLGIFEILTETIPLFSPYEPLNEFEKEKGRKKLDSIENANSSIRKYILEPEKLTFFPVEALGYLLRRGEDEGSFSPKEKISPLLKKLTDQYSVYRWEHLGGASGLDAVDCEHIKTILSYLGVPWSEMDFTFQLTRGMYPENDLTVWANSRESGELRGKDKNSRLEAYASLANAVKSEGLFELSAAFWAFFLLSQAISHRGQLGTLSKIIPFLQEALGQPGAELVKDAIRRVVSWNESIYSSTPGAAFVAKALGALLPKESPTKVFSQAITKTAAINQITRTRRSQVEEDLRLELLGPERWQKLSEKSKDFLLDAELKWRLMHGYLETGLKEWGPLILEYCKVFENELLIRLESVFNSPGYLKFLESKNEKHPGRPAAGQLLRMLRMFEKMPSDLQEAVEATGSNLHRDKKLTSEVISMILGYRNPAAHSETMDGVAFAKFRKKYFSQGLLNRFVDSLR